MKKGKFFRKTLIALVVIIMSVSLFAGCQNKSSNSGTEQTANNNTQSSKRPDPEQMKKRMQDNIKPLVSDGTITQAQADKIIEAMTTNNRKNRSQGNQQNNNSNNSQNSNQSNNPNRPRNNALSELVSNGTITQAQEDAVMQKIRGNSAHKNNGQGTQNNGQSSQSNEQKSN